MSQQSVPGAADLDTLALLDRARTLLPRAYADYSSFPVGAVVLTRAGNLFDGVNVENAAFGSTICAERVAIGSMVTAGDLSGIRVVAVTGHGLKPLSPCGACRQVIFEFGSDALVLGRGDSDEVGEWTASGLLPEGFGPARLAAGDQTRRTDT